MQGHTYGHSCRMKCWMSHHNFSVLSVFNQSAFESDGESGRHQREDCAGIWSSATGVTCDYRSEDLNEYTIYGPFTASLHGAGNSQSAVYLIIAPCLCFSGVAQGLVALLRGNLRGIIERGGWVINSHFHEFTNWSLDSNQQPNDNKFASATWIWHGG